MALGKQISAEQVPAVTWHFQSTSQFISSASWEVNTRKFFPVLHVSPCRGLGNDKVQRRKEAAEAARSERMSEVTFGNLAGAAYPEPHLWAL